MANTPRTSVFLRHLVVLLTGMAVASGIGCTGPGSLSAPARTDCLEGEIGRIEKSAEMQTLNTLDGGQVELSFFFDRCAQLFPACVLAPKFYRWKNEVKKIRSETPDGTVQHMVRMYHNPVSVCSPERRDPCRVLGDVAEVYDPEGGFMGLAVYMGQGYYSPIPAKDNGAEPVGPGMILPR
jgi:hypothetical protein